MMPKVQVADQIFNSDYPAEAVAIKKRVQQDFDPLLGDRFKHPLPRRILEVQMQVEKEFLPEIRRVASAYYDQPMQVDPAHAPTPPCTSCNCGTAPSCRGRNTCNQTVHQCNNSYCDPPRASEPGPSLSGPHCPAIPARWPRKPPSFSKKLVALAGGNVYTAIQCTHRGHHSSKNGQRFRV